MYLLYGTGKYIESMKNEVLIEPDKEFVYIDSEFTDSSIFEDEDSFDKKPLRDMVIIKMIEKDIVEKELKRLRSNDV